MPVRQHSFYNDSQSCQHTIKNRFSDTDVASKIAADRHALFLVKVKRRRYYSPTKRSVYAATILGVYY